MISLGIFAKTFSRPTFAEILDAVMAHGIKIIHINYSCVGLGAMPDQVDPEIMRMIRHETQSRGIQIAGVSGTFNMIDPDINKRKKGLERLGVIAKSCSSIGTSLVTLCTGTRDPTDMWRGHPDNSSKEAWNDLMTSMGAALRIAEETGVILGVEPEFANVIDTAKKARQLLDECNSKHLKIIMDPANLFLPGNVSSMSNILTEAFDLLGNDIIVGHAKDFIVKENTIHHVAAGKGILDYDLYLKLFQKIKAPLVLHGLSEEEVTGSIEYIKSKIK